MIPFFLYYLASTPEAYPYLQRDPLLERIEIDNTGDLFQLVAISGNSALSPLWPARWQIISHRRQPSSHHRLLMWGKQ
jgi:hypothetical protein